MELNFNLEKTYIPEWNGNKKLKDDEQVKVIWKLPTYAERKTIKHFANPTLFSKDVELIVDFAKAVEICVTKIQNLKINGKVIKNGNDLISQPGTGEWVDDIGGLIVSQMDKFLNGDNPKN